MKKLTIAFSLITLAFISCTTTNKSVTSVAMKPTSMVDPMKADYTVDINAKLNGSSKSTWLLGLLRISGDAAYADGVTYASNMGQGGFANVFGMFGAIKLNQVKAAAAFNSMSGSDADFIANPNYTVKQTKILFGLIKSYEADITGYKGKYTKIYQGESLKK
jgi:uncharacterized FlgJ-related protein